MQTTFRRGASTHNVCSYYREQLSRSITGTARSRHDAIKSRIVRKVSNAKITQSPKKENTLFGRMDLQTTPRFRPCIKMVPNICTTAQNSINKKHQRKRSQLQQLKNLIFKH